MTHGTRRIRTSLVHLAAAALLICATAPHLAAQSLSIQADHFRVDNQDKFLIFLSYFDAMNADPGIVDTDFIYIKNTLHVDGVRILPNWWDTTCSPRNCYSSGTLMTPTGLRSGKLARLQSVLTAARTRGLLVDLSFSRETVCGTTGVQTCPAGQTLTKESYASRIGEVLEALNSSAYNHVLVDLQNEFDNTDPDNDGVETQKLTEAQLTTLTSDVRAGNIGTRYLTASATQNDTGAENLGGIVHRVGLDIAAFHDPRVGNWETLTDNVVESLRTSFGSVAVRPIYLQEPTGWQHDTIAGHFATAVLGARTKNAAAWTFHTNIAYALAGQASLQIRLQADPDQAAAIAGLRAAADQACNAPSVTPSTQGVGSTGGTVFFTVTTPVGCAWTATKVGSGISGLTVSADVAAGNGTVTVVVPNNPAGGSQQLLIAGQTVTVSQTACAITIAPTSILTWPSAGTGSVVVTAPAACTWTATSGAPWLSITSNGTGPGPKTLTFSVTANYDHALVPRSALISVNGQNATVTQARMAVAFDYNGDGHADPTVVRPSTGQWLISQSGGGTPPSGSGIQAGDIPVSGDFDGDGKADLGVWRPSNKTWYIFASASGFALSPPFVFGSTSSDIPAPADFDGDGITDAATFTQSTGTWHIRLSASGAIREPTSSVNGDVPRAADFDHDGKADVAFWRPSNGNWFFLTAASNFTAQLTPVPFGSAGDIPIPGDFDGDGWGDEAVYRPSTGAWFVRLATGATGTLTGGQINDVPRAADFDGDGKTDLAVWRPSNGAWYIFSVVGNGTSIAFPPQPLITWGQLGDLPLSDTVSETPCSVGVSTTSLTTWPSELSGSFNVTTSAPGCLWATTTDMPAWVTITGGVAGFGAGTVTFTVKANITSGDRLAHIAVTGNTVNVSQGHHATGLDVDGDHRADPTIFRPSTGQWTASQTSGTQLTRGGAVPGDVPVSGDFDGDGKTDLAVWRPSNGVWYVLQSSFDFATNPQLQIPLGSSGDVPVSADFDGDGKTDAATYTSSTGTWHVLFSSTSAIGTYSGGQTEDIPRAADFDGDGKADLVFWRPSNGFWYILTSRSGYNFNQQMAYQFGAAGDIPIAADFDHDGIADWVTYTSATGTWHVRRSTTQVTTDYGDGVPEDLPRAADYDGDGKADLIFYRPSNGYWFIIKSNTDYDFNQKVPIQWGIAGDVPLVPANF